MNTSKLKKIFLGLVLLVQAVFTHAHPTGNMITVGETVLWPYIFPINDPDHHACIMIWTKGSQPKVFLQSKHAASDFMLYNDQNEIYIIERKFTQTAGEFQVRVLKSTSFKEPKVIWDWFKDDFRIGEGGFIMLSEDEMVFGKYPGIYRLPKGKKPEKYFEFDQPIKRIRVVGHKKILLLGDNSCYLVQHNGAILKQWNDLINQKLENTPLNLNQVFDADYTDGELLISYWGGRSFDLITSDGKRQILLQQNEPLTPHWVAFWNKEKLLFSSKLIFDGSTPRPHLILLNKQQKQHIVWSTP